MDPDLIEAINGRWIVTFGYKAGGARTVEPHCLGTSTAGTEVLRGYQTGGASRSGNPVAWKLFKVGEIGLVTITKETFEHNRPHYNPADKGMRIIAAHV